MANYRSYYTKPLNASVTAREIYACSLESEFWKVECYIIIIKLENFDSTLPFSRFSSLESGHKELQYLKTLVDNIHVQEK